MFDFGDPATGVTDPNFPLSSSNGIVELFPAGGENTKLEVPTETAGRYWIIGSFNGVDGLKEIDISNTVVSDINPVLNDLCSSPSQTIQIAEISSKPPKRPTFRIDERQRQSSIFNIDYESLPITNFF